MPPESPDLATGTLLEGGEAHVYLVDSHPRFVAKTARVGTETAKARLHREWAILSLLGRDLPESLPRVRRWVDATPDHHATLILHRFHGLPVREAAIGQELSRIVRWGAVAARALNEIHRRGIIHRDVSPSNLLVRLAGRAEDDMACLIDFGLARAFTAEARERLPSAEAAKPLTLTGDALGTYGYMAPEQARGESTVGPRADVWSLAATLHALVFGENPYGETAALALREASQRGGPLRLGTSASPDFDRVLAKALQAEPGLRYRSAWEMAEDLERVLQKREVRARRPSIWARLRVLFSKRRVQLGVLLVSALGLLGAWGWRTNAGRREVEKDLESIEAERRAAAPLDLELAVLAHTGRVPTEGVRDVLRRIRPEGLSLRERARKTSLEVQTLERMKDDQGALQLARLASSLWSEVVRLPDASDADLAELGLARVRIGDLLKDYHGRLDDAARHYEETLVVDQSLVDRNPRTPRYLDNLAHSHERIARIHFRRGDVVEAAGGFARMHALGQRLLELDTQRVISYEVVAVAAFSIGEICRSIGERADMRGWFTRALEAARRGYELDPDHKALRRRLFRCLANASRYAVESKDPAALDLSAEALALARETAGGDAGYVVVGEDHLSARTTRLRVVRAHALEDDVRRDFEGLLAVMRSRPDGHGPGGSAAALFAWMELHHAAQFMGATELLDEIRRGLERAFEVAGRFNGFPWLEAQQEALVVYSPRTEPWMSRLIDEERRGAWAVEVLKGSDRSSAYALRNLARAREIQGETATAEGLRREADERQADLRRRVMEVLPAVGAAPAK